VVDGGLGSGPVGYLDMVGPHLSLGACPGHHGIQPGCSRGNDPAAGLRGGSQPEDCARRESRRGAVRDVGVFRHHSRRSVRRPSRARPRLRRRTLHEGEEFSVVDLDLRSPDYIPFARNTSPGDWIPPALPTA
jgi:hypothetical protein